VKFKVLNLLLLLPPNWKYQYRLLVNVSSHEKSSKVVQTSKVFTNIGSGSKFIMGIANAQEIDLRKEKYTATKRPGYK